MTRPSFFAILIATGFGAGFWPWGPGTAGALLATRIWLAAGCLVQGWGLVLLTLVLCVGFTAAGTWATARLMPFWGNDPKRVVADEMVGVWIPLLAVPATSWQLALWAFVLFRFFDIVKPLGIRTLDRRVGAFWVMADDILAGLYSLVVVLLTQWVI